MLAGLPQAPTDYNPILNPAGARERRNEVLAKMADLGYISPAEAAAAEDSGLGLDVAEGFFKHRQPYFFDYVEDKLIEAYGVNTVRQGGLDVYTTIDPKLQRGRARSDALGAPLRRRPLLGLRLDRPAQRLDPGDGLQLQLRQQPVQPRRPGAPAAGLDLQDLRPDHGAEAGRRPLLDLLRLQTAEHRHRPVGPLGRAHRRRGLPRVGQPPAGDRRLRQHRLRPARPRRRPRTGRRNGALDGDHQPARRDPGGGDRRPAGRRLAARDVECLRDPRRRRHPPRPGRDPPRRLPRRAGRASPRSPIRGGSSRKRSPTR